MLLTAYVGVQSSHLPTKFRINRFLRKVYVMYKVTDRQHQEEDRLKVEDAEETDIRSLKREYRGKQATILAISVASAPKALSAGKVRIEWIVCKLRQ